MSEVPAGWCAPFPFVAQVHRGGIKFNTETNAQREKREAFQKATAAWRVGLPGIETGQVWLAVRDDGHDGDVLLEVCTSPERARAVCQHDAEEPQRWTDYEQGPIDWSTEEWGPSSGRSRSRYYRVERKPLMA